MNKHILEDAAFPPGNKGTEAYAVSSDALCRVCSTAAERQGGGAARAPWSLAAHPLTPIVRQG